MDRSVDYAPQFLGLGSTPNPTLSAGSTPYTLTTRNPKSLYTPKT